MTIETAISSELTKLNSETGILTKKIKEIDAELIQLAKKRDKLKHEVSEKEAIASWVQRIVHNNKIKEASSSTQRTAKQDWTLFLTLLPYDPKQAKTAKELWRQLPQIGVVSNCNAVHNKLAQLKKKGLILVRNEGNVCRWYREDRTMPP